MRSQRTTASETDPEDSLAKTQAADSN